MKRIALITLLMFAGRCAFAQYGRMDYSLQNAQGQAIAGATVNVYSQAACGAPAGALGTLYPSATGGTPLAQPLHTDGFGHTFAYVASGCYTVTYFSTFTGTQTFPDQSPSGGGGGGGGTPNPPPYSIQIADATASHFSSDPNITIDPVGHTVNVGVLGPHSVKIMPLSTPTDWFFNTASAATALDSIFSITTLGSSGPATLTGTVLNIPQYSGGGGGNCGPVGGDNTSTDCGFQNRVGDTAVIPSTVQTFGSNNLPANAATEIAAYGHQNLNLSGTSFALNQGRWLWLFGDNNIQGGTSGDVLTIKEVGAIGDTNLCAAQFGTATITDSFFYGETNGCFNGSGHMTQRNVLAMGDASFNATYGAATDNYDDVVALGDTTANLGNGTGNDTSSDLVAIGDGAVSGYNLTDFIGMGNHSGGGNDAADVVAVGDNSATNLASTHDLVAIGDDAILGTDSAKTSGHDLVAIGNHSLACNTTGTDNVAIGDYAGANGWIGYSSCGNANKTGNDNTWVGPQSGPNTTTQLSNTIALGYQAVNTVSNQTTIGNASITQLIAYGTGNGCLSASSGVITGSGSACGAGGGGASNVTVNGGSTLTTANFGSLPAAAASFINVTWQASAPNISAEVPYGSASTFGVLKCDGSTITCAAGVATAVTSTGLSGMTTGQAAVAGSGTTVTGSKAFAGSGAGITTGPTSSTSGDLVTYTGTAGQTQDSGTLLTALAPKASPTFTGTITTPITGSTQCVHVNSSGVMSGVGFDCTPSIANIQVTTGTTLIAANTCTANTPTAMTGVAITSAFSITPTSSTNAVTGWGSTGGLVFSAFPTANTFNWSICNQTGSAITPGSVTWNVGAK